MGQEYIAIREVEEKYGIKRGSIENAIVQAKISTKYYKKDEGSRQLKHVSIKPLLAYIEKLREKKKRAEEKREKNIKFVKAKENLLSKIEGYMKENKVEDLFSVSIRRKKQEGDFLEYPARTICGCDGETYNTLMNWAYQKKIPKGKAFDSVMDKFQKQLGKIKQRPKEADNASMRYWKSKAKINEKKDK